MQPRQHPDGRQRRDDVADIDAIEAIEEVFIQEVERWVDKGEIDYARVRDARSLMLDHLRRARQEGPLA